LSRPVYFFLLGSDYKSRMKVNGDEAFNEIFIEHEEYYSQGIEAIRDKTGKVKYEKETKALRKTVTDFGPDRRLYDRFCRV
jgi:hypothetical protein